ncbi:hypothetical protein HanPI659440_Chr17g0683911 [Helianthus annuus]|nr:hypothetical protein HanPI659440_Chr17g0683911 [Helianthus annuus]
MTFLVYHFESLRITYKRSNKMISSNTIKQLDRTGIRSSGSTTVNSNNDQMEADRMVIRSSDDPTLEQ